MGHSPTDRFRGHVDQLQLVGAAHDRIRHGLALRRARDARDDVVQRFEMLDVDRRDHVDPGVEQLLHVLPALLVPRSRSVGVCVLVDQHDVRPPRQDGVEIHLFQRGAAVLDLLQRHHLEVADLCGCLMATVRLDDADHHIGAALLASYPFAEHPVRLADAR